MAWSRTPPPSTWPSDQAKPKGWRQPARHRPRPVSARRVPWRSSERGGA